MDTSVMVFTVRPEPVEITAADIGTQLSADSADKQAAILAVFALDVEEWTIADNRHGGWPMQCRAIAEEMSDEDCRVVAGVLEPLIDHLRGIPLERRHAAEAEQKART